MCNESAAQRRYLAGLRRRRRGITAARWGILAVFLLLWEASARLGLIDAFLLSSPGRMAARCGHWRARASCGCTWA